MKTKNSQEERQDQPAETRDPFAVDIFERHSEKEGEEGFALESVRAVPLPEGVSRDWSAGLETVSYGEASESETPRYPDWIDEKVANYGLPSLSKLFPGAGPGKFEIVAFEDMDAKEALSGGSFRKSLFLVLELNGNAGVIEISADLAKQVVARLLGQGNGEFESTRSLSTIEQAICEYVAATVLSGLNKGISGTIRLVGAETAIDINQLPDRILRLDCEITLGGGTGQLKLFLGPETLSKLNAQYEKSSSDDVSRVERFAGFIEDWILNLTIGKTKVPAIEIPFFETDDIVLIESPVASWWQGSYECGPILCRVSGSNVSIKGRFVAEAEEGHPRFRVSAGGADLNAKRFTRFSPPASFKGDKDSMDSKKIEDAQSEPSEEPPQADDSVANEEGSLVALENVMVDLRVQVAGKRLTLNELGALRAGQIIDLGCRPEDPVELIADNSDRPIASGELVTIDDQLGVRITKVFV